MRVCYEQHIFLLHAGHFEFETYALILELFAIMAVWLFHFTTYVMVMFGNRFKRRRYRCHHICYAL
jgi:hypothetical protein